MTAPTQPYAQRWREGSPCARPLGEVADVSRLSVVPLGRDADARAFVEAHHYSGSYPDLRAWLAVALAEVARKVRHPGSHRYGWALNKRAWRSDVQRLTYPKGIEQ